MDQIVNRPSVDSPTSIASALDLNEKPGRRQGPAAVSRDRRCRCFSPHLAAPGIGGPQPAQAPVEFTTAPVKRGDLTVEVSATGTLQPLIQVDISSELSGVVRSVNVDENDTVKKGDVLAELDTVRIAANVDRAEASVKVARGQGRPGARPR